MEMEEDKMGQDAQNDRTGEEMGMAAKSTWFLRSQGRKEWTLWGDNSRTWGRIRESEDNTGRVDTLF